MSVADIVRYSEASVAQTWLPHGEGTYMGPLLSAIILVQNVENYAHRTENMARLISPYDNMASGLSTQHGYDRWDLSHSMGLDRV